MKITKSDLEKYKSSLRKITMVTSYDSPCASIADECGIDVVLVGDSVGTNVLGYSEVSQVTMEDMVHHVRAVASGVRRAFVLADLPAEAIASPEEALHNAQRLVENGADGVKIEGGTEVAGRIEPYGATGNSRMRAYRLYSSKNGSQSNGSGQRPETGPKAN